MSFVREPNAEPIPGYRLIEPLGSGGFGEAWKCEAPGGLFKAIKFVFGNLNSLDVDGARAEQELKALNRVKEVRHPFVLSMDRIEEVNGELIIVMELADSSLHDAYEEALSAGLVGIPHDVLLRYIRDAAEALDHMNEKHGLQHLDIKPRNLFLVSDRVKVADFGLVKHLERSGGSGIMGAVTPLYAAPETFGGTISDRSDQYSLAIVYQELLTGHRPFNGKNARQLANQHMNEAPDLRALPEHERPIIARALEKDPARRFPNCLAFVRALYTARAPALAHVPGEESKAKSNRTMVDTLESFQLEGLPPEDELQPVDLPPEVLAAHLDADGQSVSNLGVTVAQPSTGSLRPTLIVGVGGYGRRALLELRCRLIDRFGDLDRVPLIRFLYIDSDAEAIKVAQKGAAEVAFRTQELYHLPLQPNKFYQNKRRLLDQLDEWLPAEKRYAMPRSLKTVGIRALGRLAFTESYLRLLARLKREIQQACHPDAIYQTVSATGLALRDNVPRVYVVGCANGGASGYLADLGYAIRRLLGQMHQPEAPVVSLLFCGAPEDPATPQAEQANLYATLTELNHFSDPAVPFNAQYGVDGPRLVDDGPAFDQVYLVTQRHRTAESRRDALSQMGNYLFHEITTPLGLRLDQARLKRNPATPFRSLGTFAVWFPRGLLLRVAARDACQRVMEGWQEGAGAPLTSPEKEVVQAARSRVLADPELATENLSTRLVELAGSHMDGHPRDVLTRLLAQLEMQSKESVAQDDPGTWARQTLHRVREWLGTGVGLPGVSAVQQRKSNLTRALEAAANQLAREWDDRLGEVIDSLMVYPGRRIAVAEAAVSRLIVFCEEQQASHQQRLKQLAERSTQESASLDSALHNCLTGSTGWSLFGGRSRRLLRVFVDHLAAFARQCLAEDTAAAVLQFFSTLHGKLADRLRDLGFCRQRLRHIQEMLSQPGDDSEIETENVHETMTFTRTIGQAGWGTPSPLGQTPLLCTETYWQAIRESSTHRVVLPQGDTELEQAARRFLQTLSVEHWTQLDQAVGELVLSPRGGLLKMCLDTADLVRYFASPLLSQAIASLSEHLPITDVAQVEAEDAAQLQDHILTYHAQARPLLTRAKTSTLSGVMPAGRTGNSSGVRGSVVVNTGDRGTRAGGSRDQHSFLLVPASEAGKAFAEEARRIIPELHLVNVPGQADLTFCREQAALGVEDLERILHPCRNAYHELALTPQSSPHARFDIHDWTPLDP
jgi:serine/threonine protein kinase